MKIYVVTFETVEEHSLVVGAYSSIEKAIEDVATWTDGADMGYKAPDKDAWSRQGSYVDDWENVVAQAEVKDAANQHALIYELKLDPEPGQLKKYRCKHFAEAMRWTDTDADREAFSAWFETHNAVFETIGPVAYFPTADVRPEHNHVKPGEWIVFSDGEFLAMEDWQFHDMYEEAP